MSIDRDKILAWMEAYAAALAENKSYLTDLDSAIGDGDHGFNMDRGFQAVGNKLSSTMEQDIGAIFKVAAMTLISTVGGASGPLYGTYFLQMGMVTGGKTDLTLDDWISAVGSGIDGVIRHGKANPGDKTMIDSLLPALEALKTAATEGKNLTEALVDSANAAAHGMRDTIPMVAKKGRASYLARAAQVTRTPVRLLLTCCSKQQRKYWRSIRMIGIVIVSHSAKLAEGVVELAKEMGGGELPFRGVGGLDTPDRPLGTDPLKILEAIESVYCDDGVLVLMDLGSALLSGEMALEMLPPEKAENVRLCAAPLVEGALAAAVQAQLGSSIEQAAAEAQNALGPKIAHLGELAPGIVTETLLLSDQPDETVYSLSLNITNPLGLHARPAARFVQTVGRFPEAKIQVNNQTTGGGPVSARSINGVTTLGVRQGHEIWITAAGPQAQAALDAIQQLADHNFGDEVSNTERHTQLFVSAREGISQSNSAPDLADPIGEPLPGAFAGVSVSPGIAIGPVIHFRTATPAIPKDRIDDPQPAWDTLIDSIDKTRAQIKADIETTAPRMDEYTAAIFEAHLLFLDDEALLSPTRARIFDQKINPAAAWMLTIEDVISQYRELEDAYLQTRARDVEDVGKRVLLNLLGAEPSSKYFDGTGILVASDLTTAEMAQLDPAKVRGILTAFGGPTSHAAILAGTLGIPTIAGLGERILDLRDGTTLIVDGDEGGVWVDPEAEWLAEYQRLAQAAAEKRKQILAESREPAITRDGRPIEVVANISIATESEYAVESGAEGVGVFRTEYLFLGRKQPPDEDEQVAAYRTAAVGLDGWSLIIRTLDAGGDKIIPYLNVQQEANPFLGSRGLRLCLVYPELFKTQLRAIVRVAAEFPVKIMFPMVSTLAEWATGRTLLDDVIREVGERGQPHPEKIETGIMVEVPAAALLADHFAEEVDFFSIGTNDLTQYLLAAERGNPKVSHLSDALHPVVLQMIERVVAAAHARGKWVGVCGELAGDPQAIPILVGLGVDELSMNAPAIPQAKQIIRELDTEAARELAQSALNLDSAAAVRAASH